VAKECGNRQDRLLMSISAANEDLSVLDLNSVMESIRNLG